MIVVGVLNSARANYDRIRCSCDQAVLVFTHVSDDHYTLSCPSCKRYADLTVQWYDHDYHEYPEDFELAIVTNIAHFADDEVEIQEILRLFSEASWQT